MMVAKRDTLSKEERLCAERRIEALFKGGRRGSVGPLKFCWIAVEGGESTVRDDCGNGKPEEDAGVAVLFSVPKKAFKMAWKRNLIKRRMRESYRRRKHQLADAARATGRRIDIALICMPEGAKPGGAKKGGGLDLGHGGVKTSGSLKQSHGGVKKRETKEAKIPDFKTIDNAISKILEQIAARNRA